MPKQAEAKRDGVINPTKLQFQSILNTEKFDALQMLRMNQVCEVHVRIKVTL